MDKKTIIFGSLGVLAVGGIIIALTVGKKEAPVITTQSTSVENKGLLGGVSDLFDKFNPLKAFQKKVAKAPASAGVPTTDTSNVA